MKKINLFFMAAVALLMLACSDYVGELNDAHEENVELIREIRGDY